MTTPTTTPTTTPFGKDTKEALELLDMLVTKQICMEAEPSQIGKMFPTIVAGNFKAAKIKGGITRVKKEARAMLVSLARMKLLVPEIDNEGKKKKG